MAGSGAPPATRATAPHDGHGPWRPVVGWPELTLGGVRRTSRLDVLRPDGLSGDLVLHGIAMDERGTGDARRELLDRAQLDAVISLADAPMLSRLVTAPPRPALDRLIGGSASSGVRRAVAMAVPGDVEDATLLALLLDDLPVAVVISGYAIVAEPIERRPPSNGGKPHVDLCSGWRAGGTMITTLTAAGALPVLVGPAAPVLPGSSVPGTDQGPPLPVHGMRRWRRMDVMPEGDRLLVDAWFRDSHITTDGEEKVVHEYELQAEVRRGDLTVLALSAEPRVLPWQECPAAASSAARLVGQPVHVLRQHVRKAFVGTTTCTHLNDMLRSLGDILALDRAIQKAPADGGPAET